MNELLQKHGCSNVFSMPEGLKELMSDISREVLRDQPINIYDYISNYLSALLITREHGILAVKILDDLCDCKPSVSEHLLQIGLPRADADLLAQVIKDEVVGFEPVEGREKVRETQILMKVLKQVQLDEEMVAKVCHVARNAFRDYWYRKKMLEQSLKVQPDEPWEVAAQHTLDIYKTTRPSFCELNRATQKIQAAYRGYHVRRNLLGHLKPKPKKTGPKVELPGAPIDIADSRDIDLGRVIDIKVKDDNVGVMFEDHASAGLGLKYDPMRTITHVEDDEDYDDMDDIDDIMGRSRSGRQQSRMMSSKSMNSRLQPPLDDRRRSRAEDVTSTDSLDVDDSQSMGSQVPAADISLPKISFASKTNEVIEQLEAGELLAEELPEIGKLPEVLDYFEHPERVPEGPEEAQEGPEEAPKGPEGAPDGPEGAPEGPEGAPVGPQGESEGTEGAPEGPEGEPEIPEDLPGRRSRSRNVDSADSASHVDDTQSMQRPVTARNMYLPQNAFPPKTNEVKAEPKADDPSSKSELPVIGKQSEVLDDIESPEGAPKGPEGAPDGPEGAPEGPEGTPEGSEGTPEGSEGEPDIPDDFPELLVADEPTEKHASAVSIGIQTDDGLDVQDIDDILSVGEVEND